jgi:hypothetical protein
MRSMRLVWQDAMGRACGGQNECCSRSCGGQQRSGSNRRALLRRSNPREPFQLGQRPRVAAAQATAHVVV